MDMRASVQSVGMTQRSGLMLTTALVCRLGFVYDEPWDANKVWDVSVTLDIAAGLQLEECLVI